MKNLAICRKLLLLACAILALQTVGCKSASPSHYISPRVEGRVVDSQTHQAIKGVQVRRVTADESYRVESPAKGGRLMEQNQGVRTGADGIFVLASQTVFTPFRDPGWYSVSIAFKHPGYDEFMATYTVAQSTNTAKGEPLVNAGDVLLMPLSK
jgi:hypothetical protein